jgi:hypothetical protein
MRKKDSWERPDIYDGGGAKEGRKEDGLTDGFGW